MLLVAIHDVTPAHAEAVDHLWSLCAARGVVPALLVVPEWHGSWPLEAHPGFVERLRACAALGAEVFLHGERHDEVGRPRGPADAWRAWGRTAREAEFLTLDLPRARERLDRGLTRLRALGLEPIGFVAPAWLAREEAYAAAAGAGLRLAEDARSIRLLASGRRLPSPVVRWSARSRLRARGSVMVAEVRWRAQRHSPQPRIALHPADVRDPGIARSIGRTLDRWLSVARPGRYTELLA